MRKKGFVRGSEELGVAFSIVLPKSTGEHIIERFKKSIEGAREETQIIDDKVFYKLEKSDKYPHKNCKITVTSDSNPDYINNPWDTEWIDPKGRYTAVAVVAISGGVYTVGYTQDALLGEMRKIRDILMDALSA